MCHQVVHDIELLCTGVCPLGALVWWEGEVRPDFLQSAIGRGVGAHAELHMICEVVLLSERSLPYFIKRLRLQTVLNTGSSYPPLARVEKIN